MCLFKTALIYLSKYLPFTPSLCDNCYQEQQIEFFCKEENCDITVSLPEAQNGWQASFVELFYHIDDREFIITSEVNVSPDTYPEYVE